MSGVTVGGPKTNYWVPGYNPAGAYVGTVYAAAVSDAAEAVGVVKGGSSAETV